MTNHSLSYLTELNFLLSLTAKNETKLYSVTALWLELLVSWPKALHKCRSIGVCYEEDL